MSIQRLPLFSILLILPLLGINQAMSQSPVAGATQSFPSKTIRLVTSGTGGGNDVTARLVGHHVTRSRGWPVIVDNRGSVVPGETVARADPDGYTLLFGTNSLWVGALLRKVP